MISVVAHPQAPGAGSGGLGDRRADQRRALSATYVEQVLVPTLAPGDIVILDNLGSRNGRRARRAIRDAGAHLLFLPPYSPDLNPIERLFAKPKHLMRAATPPSVEKTWRKADRPLDIVSPAEGSNHLATSGHASARNQQTLARDAANRAPS
ncbi:MAG: transposase, partial [Acetobacteraceae bacterium]|nr:transposase [Acetobacteraceae bacterium]